MALWPIEPESWLFSNLRTHVTPALKSLIDLKGVAPLRHPRLQKLELIQTSAGRPRWNEADQPGGGSPQPVAPPPPLQTLAFAAHERPQPATNGLDLSQGLSPKFDLGLKHANIPQRNGRNHKVVDVILQTTQGGLHPEHFQSPRKKTTTV
jgi:hypothetical protein